MSDKVVLVPNGDAVYAVPVDVCEKYALEGDALASAQSVLGEESDVEGQRWGHVTRNSRGEAYQWNTETGGYHRAPYYD